ncbi:MULTISPECIES: hypothetical protein [unclassified Moorena]|uniref:hypothetical protein n=1 Tax=unclassified Moorena TaxID=2683338 RepID=UPI0013C603D7|nr:MULTISPECIES: hypothetical protein [unclassified Moorena]NEO22682.1 hypothetical protein [Moorena sp. SIO4A5]NEQ60230.1 hypothetical protein [Moorena sp. SIO4A1]
MPDSLIPDARFPMPDARCPMPDSRFPIPDSRLTVTESATQTISLLLSISLGISNTEGKSNEQIT